MEIVSARNFRANQTSVFSKILKGESVIISSRLGMFQITPVSEDKSLTARIREGLQEVKLMESGKLPSKSAKSFLDEL